MVTHDRGTRSIINTKSLTHATVSYDVLLLTLKFLSALNLENPALGNFNVAFPFASVNVASNDHALNRDLLQKVRDGHDVTATGLSGDDHVRRDFEEVFQHEMIKSPQHILVFVSPCL